MLSAVNERLSLNQDEQSWFANMKEIGESLGFTGDRKAYKGTVSDIAEMIRLSLTTKRNSPNLYYVMQVLGKEECSRRFNQVIAKL